MPETCIVLFESNWYMSSTFYTAFSCKIDITYIKDINKPLIKAIEAVETIEASIIINCISKNVGM